MSKPKQSARVIKIEHLIGHHSNIRTDLGDLTDLAASIREHGIVQPLVVTEHPTEPDRWLILAGHRRAAAAGQAGVRAVPCVVRHNLDNDFDEQLVIMLVENCQRTDLGPVEKAEAYGVLRNRGLTLADMSRRTGLSTATISGYLALLDLDDDSRDRVRAGQIHIGQARQAVRTVRRDTRAGNGPRGSRDAQRQPGHPVVVEAAHFTRHHPLAPAVRDICDHSQRPKVGGIGCGQCWETAIRADTRPNQLASSHEARTPAGSR